MHWSLRGGKRNHRRSSIDIDDVEGYWLFPPTNDATVALTLPAAVRGSFNLSIVQETGTDGTVRVCPPQPHRMPVEHVGDPSEIPGDAVHLAPATFVSEPLACGWLDRPARVVNAVAPTVPRSVSERGITGDVRVRISLDENSELTDATIIASPSSLLNDAALESARQTTFEAEQFRCAYVPAQFMFIVSFGKRS